MSYVDSVKNTRSEGVVVSSLPLVIGEHAINDLILVYVCLNSTTTTTPSGYTALHIGGNTGGVKTYVFYKLATSTNETITVSLATANYIATSVLVIKDVDTTNPIDASSFYELNSNSTTQDAPSVTTTTNGCLVLRSSCGWNNTSACGFFTDTNLYELTYTRESGIITVLTENQSTAGSTGVSTYNVGGTERGNCGTVAIRNKTGGNIQPIPTVPWTVLKRYGAYGTNVEGTIFTSLSSSIATIDGNTVDTSFPSISTQELTSVSLRMEFLTEFSWGGLHENEWQGVTHPLVGDYSGKILSVTMYSTSVGTNLGDKGLLTIVIDGTGNWSAFQVTELQYDVSDTTFFFGDNSIPAYSSGTVDWTNIAKIGYARQRGGTGTSNAGFRIANLAIVDTLIIKGGFASKPLVPQDFKTYLDTLNMIDYSRVQGTGQVLTKVSVQVGDGVTETHFKSTSTSTETPVHYGEQYNWQLVDNDLSYIFKTSSTDIIDLSGSLTATDTQQFFTIDASSSTSASYNFTGLTLIGYTVTWKTGIDCSGASFIGGSIIDAKAAIFSNCTIAESISTTSAMTIDDGASITQGTFTRGAETYAILIAAVGSYDLTDTTFSGYTTDLNVTALTGVVTITLASGQAVPTYTSAGATVTFVQPIPTLTITGHIIGSTVVINDLDSVDPQELGTELKRVNVTTGDVTYAGASGNLVSISMFAAGYKPYYQEYTIGSTDATFTIIPVLETN